MAWANHETKKHTLEMVTMARYETTSNSSAILTNDLIGFHALFLAVIRFAVEKYGGTLRTDSANGVTQLDIPNWAEDVCFHELGELVGPGKPLNGFLAFLGG
jgi:hypothetical protein